MRTDHSIGGEVERGRGVKRGVEREERRAGKTEIRKEKETERRREKKTETKKERETKRGRKETE